MKLKTYFLLFDIFILMTFVGIACNSIVIVTNSCKMPVLAAYDVSDSTHSTMYEMSDAKFGYLGDVFKIKFSGYNIYFSFGDFCMLFGGLGFFVMLFYRIKQVRRLHKGEVWI
jgi:hypothetical protein